MSDTQNMRPDPNALAIYPLAAVEGPFRFYLAQQGTTETHVRVWTESDATYVATTIGGPSRITSGRYATDEEAIRAHFVPHDDAQRKALADGIELGWSHARAALAEDGDRDPWSTIWTYGETTAARLYPNGWNGGYRAAECRCAYIGGWAIGVERYSAGLRADGSPLH